MKYKLELKTEERNINNSRYADDNTLMEESKEELNSLLMKVKEESEKAGLKHDIHWGTRVSFPSGFLSVYAQQWDCWIIRHVSSRETDQYDMCTYMRHIYIYRRVHI